MSEQPQPTFAMPELTGEGETRSVTLDGVEVGKARAMDQDGPDPYWLIEVRLPGHRHTVFGDGRTLEGAWGRFVREAREILAKRAAYLARVAAWREKIVAQADAQGAEGWMDLAVDPIVAPSGVLRVPKAPFVRWSLDFKNNQLWPDWPNVCPSGLKVINDDANHSDWIIGAGLDPSVFYCLYGDNPQAKALNSAAYDAKWAVQIEKLSFQCAVLSGSGSAKGEAWIADQHPGELPPPGCVLVLPNLSVRWLDQALAAANAGAAIVTEEGGATAHLVSVGRERQARIVRVPNARALYKDHWSVLTVNCDRGTVEIDPPD